MSVADALRRARARIADPAHWTNEENGSDANAVRLSAFGAIVAESSVAHPPLVLLACLDLAVDDPTEGPPGGPLCGGASIRYNGRATHANVLALFDRAIAAAEERAST